tara:strand:- start:11824 stop:13035 length:1212 start_codon:yes stop_codon:yes gene_type:complete
LKLGGVFAVLALLVLVFNASRQGNIIENKDAVGKNRVFKDFPVNHVSAFAVKTSDGELNLERGESGWVVKERGGYSADIAKVGEFLTSIYDLGVVQTVPVGASKYGRVGLLSPEENEPKEEGEEDATIATILSFSKGSDPVGELWVGKEYQKTETGQFGPMETTTGRYVKRGDSPEVFVVDEKFDNLEPNPADWLNSDFFKVVKVKSIERIPSENAEEGWKLVRTDEKGDFTLEGAKEGEEIDSTKVSSMKNAFSSPSFEDVLIGDEAKAPNHVEFKVETFEGFKYSVKLSEKNDENEYLLALGSVEADLPKERTAVEGESDEDKEAAEKEFQEQKTKWTEKLKLEKSLVGHVYKVRGFVADSINKNRSELMKDPEEEEGGEATSSNAPSIPGLEGMIPGVQN